MIVDNHPSCKIVIKEKEQSMQVNSIIFLRPFSTFQRGTRQVDAKNVRNLNLNYFLCDSPYDETMLNKYTIRPFPGQNCQSQSDFNNLGVYRPIFYRFCCLILSRTMKVGIPSSHEYRHSSRNTEP